MKEEVKRWLTFAREDLRAAKDNEKLENYSLAAFLTQQAIEKALKSLLISQQGSFPRTHDLVSLGKRVRVPHNFLESCKHISPAYMYTRYPDVAEEVTHLDEKVKTYLADAEEIIEWVEAQL